MLSLFVASILSVAIVPPSANLWPQKGKPPVPDLTAAGQADNKHDWNLGPTGARGWMWGWKLETTDARQILVTEVAEDSPAEKVLEVGDVILGLGAGRFERDPRRAFGDAILQAESKSGKGKLPLLIWRKGKTKKVSLRLPVLGEYVDTAPWDCAKSKAIYQQACDHIVRNMKGDIDGMMNALALLATGEKKYRSHIKKLAHQVGNKTTKLTLQGRTSGLLAWEWGYRNLFLCEYYLATGDRYVLPAIREYSTTMARGQSGVGTWGHGMAWPDLNDGRLHGSLGGYGALNQSGLVCFLSLLLAEKCGIRDKEVEDAIERATRFFEFYAGKGAIPYGDHRPGWDVHDDNGKNSIAAIIFDLLGKPEMARFFAKMTVASYGERERGHTGNYFSFLWGPLGAARVGEDAVAAFLKEQRWYFDLARSFDGSFPYQGGAGMDGGEHSYKGWDCTAIFVLAHALPRKELMITGKNAGSLKPLIDSELEDTIAAGRGFDSWTLASDHYDQMDAKQLLKLLSSWSPAVRSRASSALAKKDGDPVPQLLRLLNQNDLNARYGGCQALGALKAKSAAAVPALTKLLKEDDVWLRIQACYALAGIGDAARSAVPQMLQLALSDDAKDPREFTQRYLAFCLFYPGGALKMKGLISHSLEGVDRDLLRDVIKRLLQNDDGRARAAVGMVYKNLSFEELKPLMPTLLETIQSPSPSGVMFANGIRLSGLEQFARYRIKEGMKLCIEVTEIDEWGKQDRIRLGMKHLRKYGGAAKAVLPELNDLVQRLKDHREAISLAPLIQLCEETITEIKKSPKGEPLLSVTDF
jgi:hypothetical protein